MGVGVHVCIHDNCSFVSLSVYRFVCLSVCMCVYLSLSLSLSLSLICLYASVYLFYLCLSVRLSACLSV